MSTQQDEVGLVKLIQTRLELGNNLLKRPDFGKRHIKLWHGGVEASLKKIFGSDSEVVRRFNSLADGALLVSDPKAGLEQLMAFASNIVETLTSGVRVPTSRTRATQGKYGITKLFLGHGRNPVWSRVETHLKDELDLKVEVFETTSRASEHIIDVLNSFLDECDAAIIVMTADDKTAEGTIRARQNVIHEVGLFQGRHGFDRVILFQQEGTEDFSNVAGLQAVRFNQRVEEGFYELDRAIGRIIRK